MSGRDSASARVCGLSTRVLLVLLCTARPYFCLRKQFAQLLMYSRLRAPKSAPPYSVCAHPHLSPPPFHTHRVSIPITHTNLFTVSTAGAARSADCIGPPVFAGTMLRQHGGARTRDTTPHDEIIVSSACNKIFGIGATKQTSVSTFPAIS